MADHCAIDEELSRLESHIAQFRDSVENGMEVGRKLDFLNSGNEPRINTIAPRRPTGRLRSAWSRPSAWWKSWREQVQNAV